MVHQPRRTDEGGKQGPAPVHPHRVRRQHRHNGRKIGHLRKPCQGRATIALNGKPRFVADADRYFSIPAKEVSDKQTLTITTVGYEPIQVAVKKLRADGQTQAVPVVLMRETVTLGFVVVETRRRKKDHRMAP